MNRREMLRATGSAVATATVLGLPAVAQELSPRDKDAGEPAGRKVLVLEKRPIVDGNMCCEFVDGAPWKEKLLW